ncbi:MAG: hypothetical protein IPG45_37205 [Deltaproteobacteria bacterium]|jgi:hypothetical protein|nr:hypothetical protein [Deltaproteobacteria bacterium]
MLTQKYWPLFGLVLLACGGSKSASQPADNPAGNRSAFEAPKWFHDRPKGVRSLFFVGDATGAPDESTARELAVQKAMAELTVYCGASIKSDFSSVEREANGQQEQVVSLTVDIAGDELTIREAVVKKTVVGSGSDGTFDAYALVEWPTSQYELVLAGQREKGGRALALYLEAEQATEDNAVGQAKQKLKEAKALLGPMKAQVPLQHDKLKNSALLWDAVSALDERLKSKVDERKKVVAVAVLCQNEGKVGGCDSRWPGAVRQKVSGKGFKVASENISEGLASEILESGSPKTDASARSAGFVLAVRYEAKTTAVEDGFTFVHCGARGVLYDTDANRIVGVKEVKPEKGGHVHYSGARDKSCKLAEDQVSGWVEEQLGGLK